MLNYNLVYINALAAHKYNSAKNWQIEGESFIKREHNAHITDNLKTLLPAFEKYGIDYPNEPNLSPLMMAFMFGAEKIGSYLVENGADLATVDIFGKNALQMVIARNTLNWKKPESLNILKNVWKHYKNEPIKLQYENKFIKIDSHQGEYWLLQFILSINQTALIPKKNIS